MSSVEGNSQGAWTTTAMGRGPMVVGPAGGTGAVGQGLGRHDAHRVGLPWPASGLGGAAVAVGAVVSAVGSALAAVQELSRLLAETREFLHQANRLLRKADEVTDVAGARISELDVEELHDLVGKVTELADVGRRQIASVDVERLRSLIGKADEVADVILETMRSVDMDRVVARLERVEQAILNTEKGTLNLDRSFEGSIESMPNFVSRRARRESTKIDPTRPPEPSPPMGP